MLSFGGKVGDAGRIERADHFIAGGKPRAGDAVRHHFGVAEDGLAGQQGRACSAGEVRREDEIAGDIDHAASVNHAHRDAGLIRA